MNDILACTKRDITIPACLYRPPQRIEERAEFLVGWGSTVSPPRRSIIAFFDLVIVNFVYVGAVPAGLCRLGGRLVLSSLGLSRLGLSRLGLALNILQKLRDG